MAAVSAAETALLSLREHQIPRLARRVPSAEHRLRQLCERREQLLSHVLLLGALAHLGTAICVLRLAPRWAAALNLPATPVLLGLFVALIGLFDGVPKMFALSRPGTVLQLGARPLLASEPVLRPLAAPLRALAVAIADRLAPKGFAPLARIEDDEVETMVKMRRDQGELPDWEAEVIHEIVKLGDKTAKDVMTPRVDVLAIDETAPAAEIDRAVRSTPHRLLPVFRGDPDSIVGVLDVSTYLHAGGPLAAATRNPVFVPETMAAELLFASHLDGPRGIAIVLDEYGGFEGIATASDIFEDLIRDAAPPADETAEIRDLGGGRFLATGAARLEDLEDELGTALARDGIDTIGGLLFTRAGALPSPGTRFEIGTHRATVRACSEKRVEEVLIEPLHDTPLDDTGGGGA